MIIVLLLLLFFSILFEATVTTLPLVLVILLCIAIFYQKMWVFPLGLLSGLLLDSLSFRIPGETSLFFLVFLYIIFLYEKKFEIQSLPFVIFTSGIGALGFLIIFHFSFIIQQTIIITLFAGLSFAFFRLFHHKKTTHESLLIH